MTDTPRKGHGLAASIPSPALHGGGGSVATKLRCIGSSHSRYGQEWQFVRAISARKRGSTARILRRSSGNAAGTCLPDVEDSPTIFPCPPFTSRYGI